MSTLECPICLDSLTETPNVPPAPSSLWSGPPNDCRCEPCLAIEAKKVWSTKCGHLFHKRCLDHALCASDTRACPFCKEKLSRKGCHAVYLKEMDDIEKEELRAEVNRLTGAMEEQKNLNNKGVRRLKEKIRRLKRSYKEDIKFLRAHYRFRVRELKKAAYGKQEADEMSKKKLKISEDEWFDALEEL